MIIWSCKINTFFILYKGLRKKSAIPLQNLLFIRLYLISFYYKDYRNNGKNKPATLPGVEFLRRFCMHILPKGFVKIRYYGILSSRHAKKTILLRVKKTAVYENRTACPAQRDTVVCLPRNVVYRGEVLPVSVYWRGSLLDYKL
ncbi:MAG: transposase [Bacteroidetes bacterium]|nr:transposase [Bacteroidota bacterium]